MRPPPQALLGYTGEGQGGGCLPVFQIVGLTEPPAPRAYPRAGVGQQWVRVEVRTISHRVVIVCRVSDGGELSGICLSRQRWILTVVEFPQCTVRCPLSVSGCLPPELDPGPFLGQG